MPTDPTPAAAGSAPAPADRVPLREKVALGCGFITSSGSQNVVHVLSSPIYNVTLGMSPVLVSVLLFVQRIWGAVLAPRAGQISDNFRSRFGRRRPLLAVAIVPLAAAFAGLWLVRRGAGEGMLFLSVLALSLLFYAGQVFYQVPLLGLQVEATADYHERTRLTGFTQVFILAFAVVPDWLFAWSRRGGGSDPVTNFHRIGIGLGALFLVTGLMPVLFTRERRYGQLPRRPARRPLRESLRRASGNRPLMLLVAVQLVFSFSYNLVGVLGLYTNFYYIYGGDIRRASVMEGWAASVFQVVAAVSVWGYRRLSARIGKRPALQVAFGVLAAGCLSKLVLFQPAHPWMILGIWAANGAGSVGVAVIQLSMLADVADFEEWRTGVRSEGLFSSIFNMADTVGYSVGALGSGIILVAIGFDVRLGGGQSPASLLLMRLLYAAVPLVGALVAALIVQRYPLSAGRSYAIKAELEERRSARPAGLPDPA
jgi:glycoside/pentoside/hexuronide:cation symporter, GPH family